MKKRNIYFLASEAVPYIKVGGLGDVAGTLPLAIRSLSDDLDVRLVIPFHSDIRRQDFDIQWLCSFNIPTKDGLMPVEVFSTFLEEVPVYFVDGPPIRIDTSVYSTDDAKNAYKYAFFSLAALGLLKCLEWTPHVIHANDWHTALAIYAVGLNRFTDPFYRHTATLLTVHNLPYLGGHARETLQTFGLPLAERSSLPTWAQDMPLPLGLLMADHIIAVSPTYAKDILTPEYGSGLDEFLSTRRESLTGILNGLDGNYWNPLTDPYLIKNYSVETLNQRVKNKISLQAECDLQVDENIPLLAMISRFDYQKGVDLAVEALRMLEDQPWQMLFLGRGDPTLEQVVMQFQSEKPKMVKVFLKYDEPLSHRIYSAADMILIPSRYEPCGLVQMIAMRYGCVPIGRATGGLKDTIRDYSQHEGGVGFLFEEAAPLFLKEAILRALKVYNDPTQWVELQRRGMKMDFSWQRSAEQYLEVYLRLIR